MAFSDFSYPEIVDDFKLKESSVPDLFANTAPITASKALQLTIEQNAGLGSSAHTEFSRAVWIVGPILADFWRRYRAQITLIGGADFRADPEAGLSGYLDFVIGRAPQTHVVNAPVMIIVEAKRDSITDGFGQCIAGMIGAQRFNQRKHKPIEAVYGCSTTGSQWRFMKLEGQELTLDLREYSNDDYEKLLGILTHIVGPVPAAIAA